MIPSCEAIDPSIIIYQEGGVLAVNKPAGIATRGDSRFPIGLRERLVETIGLDIYPVHRLDVVATGVLVYSASRNTRRNLCAQFFNREVEKIYLAIVEGAIPLSEWENNMPVDKKPAHTFFKSLKQLRGPNRRIYTLVEARPTTGRRRQIRKHLAGEGHPIAGDYDHGAHRKFAPIERPLLHALQLNCTNPETSAPLLLQVAPPEDFNQFTEISL